MIHALSILNHLQDFELLPALRNNGIYNNIYIHASIYLYIYIDIYYTIQVVVVIKFQHVIKTQMRTKLYAHLVNYILFSSLLGSSNLIFMILDVTRSKKVPSY